MIQIRKSSERGYADHGWLRSYHTFSFADYHDPRWMGFRTLRVINEDWIAAGQGFGTHPHRDMEIITYLVEGSLAHKDSLGNGSVIQPGEIQRMSAGTGVQHSEYNPSPDDPTHLLQIWILTEQTDLPPSYEQKRFPNGGKEDRWQLIASRDGREGSLTIHQDTHCSVARLRTGKTLTYPLALGRYAWIQMIAGSVSANGHTLTAGDGMALTDEPTAELRGIEAAELLLFDMP